MTAHATTPGPPAADEQTPRDPEQPTSQHLPAALQTPRLADGAELLGEYPDSGLEEPPHVIKRPDGEMVQVPYMLYAVAEAMDGRRDLQAIADHASEAVKRQLSADDVLFIIQQKLVPLGVLHGAQPAQQAEAPDPLLALKLRIGVIPSRVVGGIARVFQVFFFPPILIGLVGAFLAFDFWLFFMHGLAQGTRHLVNRPEHMLAVLGLVVLATIFHEFGHAAACRYGGGKPGKMGAGLYIVWPAFYTDLTDTHRLGKWARIRTDLGGIYFNAVFILVLGGLYAVTGYEVLLVAVALQHLQMMQQFIPFLRLDGYYVVADLTGVPDLFTRIGPVLRSLVPGREPDPRVTELKTWVRAVVTGWVVLTIPFVAYVYAMLIWQLPRIVSTGLESLGDKRDAFAEATSSGNWLGAMVAVMQIAFLVLPAGAISYSLSRAAMRIVGGAWKIGNGRPAVRALTIAGATAAVAVAAVGLWPDEDYRPISKKDRGTLQESTADLRRFHKPAPPPEASESPEPSPEPSAGQDGPSPSPNRLDLPGFGNTSPERTPRPTAGSESGSSTEPSSSAQPSGSNEPATSPQVTSAPSSRVRSEATPAPPGNV